MTTSRPHDDAVVTALSLTLDRYPWRGLTPRLIAGLAVAQRDRHALGVLLSDLPGTSPGEWRQVEPAPADDPRTQVLVAFLGSRRWRHLSSRALGALLLGLLDDTPEQAGRAPFTPRG